MPKQRLTIENGQLWHERGRPPVLGRRLTIKEKRKRVNLEISI